MEFVTADLKNSTESLLVLIALRNELTTQITTESHRLQVEKLAAKEARHQARIEAAQVKLIRQQERVQRMLEKQARPVGSVAKKAARRAGKVTIVNV